MDVNVKRAVKLFFSKSSFEMIYFEAFANAVDAGATEFDIHIHMPKAKDWLNMTLELIDNGIGFTNERFNKFKKLLDVEERTHKGLGRLVYLCYFDRVRVESVFLPKCMRKFVFSDEFDGQNEIIETAKETTGTNLTFLGFNGEKIGKEDYLNPLYIKKKLLENFYMKFYNAKQAGMPINVNIILEVGGVEIIETINSNSIPTFQVKELKKKLGLFDKITLYYHIQELDNATDSQVITALAIDDRSYVETIIAEENMPHGYEMVFLLFSETLQGSVDASRQKLTLEEPKHNQVKAIFRAGISEVINEKFPKIAEDNIKRKLDLEKVYPHLSGYFEDSEIGYSAQADVLKKAQEKYFKDQKEVLGAIELTDEQFEKSMELSARALAEYIIFRQNVVEKMSSFSGEEKEEAIHNMLVPKGTEFREGELMKNLYSNNVWVIDEKFMSYCTVLSEAEMRKVIDALTAGEVCDNDDDRPDIVLFFSGNPTQNDSLVDVVVVELKRMGLSAEQNSIVEFQLDTRTQRLAEYFGNRIQRMWFYGVVDFDDRYRLHLINNGFKPLFSRGTSYFRYKEVFTDLQQTKSVIQNAYILDYTALIEDARSRNKTFLKILQDNFKNYSS